MTKLKNCANSDCRATIKPSHYKKWVNVSSCYTADLFLRSGQTKLCSVCQKVCTQAQDEASQKPGTRQNPAPPPPASRSQKSATIPEAAASFRAAASTPRTPVLSTGSSAFRSYNLALIAQGLGIGRIVGDGNCLFRSVATQVYGDEKHHGIVREKCTDFISRDASLPNTSIAPKYLRRELLLGCFLCRR